jgi:lipopolysaccharide export system ATP-binding protein
MNPQILIAQNIQKSYQGKPVVKDVSFEVMPGQTIGLLGPNGAGKTTSFYMIVGLVKPDKGAIFFNGQNITKWPMYKRARAGIAYLPQETSIFRNLTAQENIGCVLETLKLTNKQRQKQLSQLLDDLHLEKVKDQPAITLSGGEKRRVEVARALALNPTYLLLDEPFAGIDPIAIADIQNIMLLLKERKIGILITDHNVRETLSICDLSYLLHNGTIIEKGNAQTIAQSETARKIYLGETFQL